MDQIFWNIWLIIAKLMLLPIGISTMEDFIIPIIGATSSLVIFIDN